jgi:hypothetical protein
VKVDVEYWKLLLPGKSWFVKTNGGLAGVLLLQVVFVTSFVNLTVGTTVPPRDGGGVGTATPEAFVHCQTFGTTLPRFDVWGGAL